MCDYCKEPHGKFITDGLFEQCRIDCLKDFSDKSERKIYTLCVNNGSWAAINFCPMCGRKLN